MEKNLYAPPKAELREIVNRVPRPKTAILAATLFDLVMTTAVMLLVGVVYGASMALAGATPEEIQSAAQNLHSVSGFTFIASFFGLLVSVASGYLCAWLSIRNLYRNTAIVGVLLLAIVTTLDYAEAFTPLNLLLNLLNFPALFFGTWLYTRKQAGGEKGS